MRPICCTCGGDVADRGIAIASYEHEAGARKFLGLALGCSPECVARFLGGRRKPRRPSVREELREETRAPTGDPVADAINEIIFGRARR